MFGALDLNIRKKGPKLLMEAMLQDRGLHCNSARGHILIDQITTNFHYLPSTALQQNLV